MIDSPLDYRRRLWERVNEWPNEWLSPRLSETSVRKSKRVTKWMTLPAIIGDVCERELTCDEINFTALAEIMNNPYTLKHIYCHSFSTQYKVICFSECMQDKFLKDCTSKHVGPRVSCKGFKGILTLKTILKSNIDGILSCIVGNTLYTEIPHIEENKKHISDELSAVRGSRSSNYP